MCFAERETENQDSVITEGGAKIWVTLQRCRKDIGYYCSTAPAK